MREILFRGKPTERFADFPMLRPDLFRDGWVYGSLVVCEDRYYICTYAECSNRTTVNNAHGTMIEVIPEAVGEFTGLYDIHGKRIFEGDIARFDAGYFEGRWTGVVEYDDKNGQFVVSGNKGWGYSSDDPGMFKLSFSEIDKPTLEIMGNRLDNPELLKGE